MLTNEQKQALETMIDDTGVGHVLDAISEICHGKADHIRACYASDGLARIWDKAAGSIDTAATTQSVASITPK